MLNSQRVYDVVHRGSVGSAGVRRVTYIMWCAYTSDVLSRRDKVRCLGIRWLPTLGGVGRIKGVDLCPTYCTVYCPMYSLLSN